MARFQASRSTAGDGVLVGNSLFLRQPGQRRMAVIPAKGRMARHSGQSLLAIVGLVEVVADQVRFSAAAAEEQSAAEAIGRTVDRIDRISGETAQAMAAASSAVDHLAGQAKALHGLGLDMQHEGSGSVLA
ncbi:MAG: chemotaxis protein [Acidobacteriota bacterium]